MPSDHPVPAAPDPGSGSGGFGSLPMARRRDPATPPPLADAPLAETRGGRATGGPPPLPPIIRIPPTSRARDDACTPARDVHSSGDLPRRLFLGDVYPVWYWRGDDGWHARYYDPSTESRVELTYATSADRLTIAQVWHGTPGPRTVVRAPEWSRLADDVYPLGLPADWEDLLVARLAERYNAAFVPAPPDEWHVAIFPDGLLFSVVVPLRPDDLRRAAGCVRAMDADPLVSGTVGARLVRATSTVDYIGSRCPDVPSEPTAAWRHTWRQMGLPAAALPMDATLPDGARALRVRRMHYNFVVRCSFRDLERVLWYLNQWRLVGDAARGANEVDHLRRVEFRAMVLPLEPTLGGGRVELFDAARTRRVTYESPAPLGESRSALQAAEGQPDERTAADLIAQAERHAAYVRAELDAC